MKTLGIPLKITIFAGFNGLENATILGPMMNALRMHSIVWVPHPGSILNTISSRDIGCIMYVLMKAREPTSTMVMSAALFLFIAVRSSCSSASAGAARRTSGRRRTGSSLPLCPISNCTPGKTG
jgi:hypothetical protein